MKSLAILFFLALFAAATPAQIFFGGCTATGSGSSASCVGLEGVESASGTAAIGQNTRWYVVNSSVTPLGPTWAVYATTLAAGPIPIPGFDGDLLLNPAANVIVTMNPTHPTIFGASYYDFFIPNNPALIGSQLHMQGLRLGISATTTWPILMLSAAWGVTIV